LNTGISLLFFAYLTALT